MAMTKIPKKMSEYVDSCVAETAEDVYGRDNRRPIHDAIYYIVSMTLTMTTWCNDLGLCVVDGKLCAVFDE